MVHRSGAKPGDRVVVTGTIGDAALGLDILRGGAVAAALADDAAAREMLVGRYRVPQPRNALAQGGARSCQRGDGCLRRSRRRSGKTLRGLRRVRRDRCAGHPVVRARGNACSRAAPSASRRSFPAATTTRFCARSPKIASRRSRKAAAVAGVAVTSIGTVIAGASAPRFLDAQGREIAAAAPVLQPFLRFSRKARRFRRKYLPKSTVLGSAALRRECDFGMVPPI